MPKISNVILVLKNNWKKSTFALAVLSYGINHAKITYENKLLMREYCMLASRYGDVVNPVVKPLRNITVVLNPAANRRNSKALFDKYCAPLLHLAGLAVTIVYTEYAGQAKDIADNLDPKTDALVIAGGDGTLSETITGLLRRLQDNKEVLKKLPLGVLPLGRSNSLSNALLGNREEVRALIDSTMAIIDGSIKTVDIMKIEPINEEDAKPVFGLVQVEWGSFRNAKANRDKYWYFGHLRDYVSYLFTKVQMGDWECHYTEPCKGCNKCVIKKEVNKRWWSVFLPRTTGPPEVDYSKIVNEECGKIMQKDLSTVELAIKTTTVSKDRQADVDAPHLVLSVKPGSVDWTNFVSEGWRRLRGKEISPVEVTAVRELHLVPKVQNEQDWFSIDNENFEVKPLKISILPKAVNIFHPRLNGYI